MTRNPPPTPAPIPLPEPLRVAAEALALDLADGRTTFQSVAAALHLISGEAAPDWAGTRAIWHARDYAADLGRRRQRARWSVIRAVRPLFAAKAARETIESAAWGAAGDALDDGDIFGVLIAEHDAAARGGRRYGR